MDVSDHITPDEHWVTTSIKSAGVKELGILQMEIHLVVYLMQVSFDFEPVFQFDD